MPVSARDLEELRRLKLAMPEHGGADLSALQSVAEVVAYVATASRAEGGNPADEAELLIRHNGQVSPDGVRCVASVLKALGYAEVSQRLFEIAGKRKLDLRPLT
jgi:hypothetical protein